MVLNKIGLVLGLGLVLASYITPPERDLGRGLPLPRENNILLFYYIPLGARDRRYMVINTIGLVLGLGLGLVLASYITPRVARCPVFDRTVRFIGDLSGQKYDAKPDN